MTPEEQLNLLREEIRKRNRREALNFFGAFCGAICAAMDNPYKWKTCLKAAQFASETADSLGIMSVETREDIQ